MYNVYVPVQVSLLLRRVVNLLSTLALSEQYYNSKASPASPQRWPWPSIALLSATVQGPGGIVLPAKETQQQSSTPPAPPPGTPPTSPIPITKRKPDPDGKGEGLSSGIIHELMRNPALRDPLRTPRYPIVLSHGLFGFDVRGPSTFPSLRMHYWSNVLRILRDTLHAEVIVTSVPGTGTIVSRAEEMHSQLDQRVRNRGINILAHSMGGLDSRHLITHLKPTSYTPLSLTCISTPHRGSAFMDWCADNIGIGKIRQRSELLSKSSPQNLLSKSSPQADPTHRTDLASPHTPTTTSLPISLSTLPTALTTLLLSIVDSPAYSNLTTSYLNDVFNPSTPNSPHVKYFSVAGRIPSVGVWHPFWLPKLVLDGVEERERGVLRAMNGGGRGGGDGGGVGKETDPMWARESEWGNDGLVSVQSAKWGEFMGIIEGADHWEMRGARGIQLGLDRPLISAGGGGSSWGGSISNGGGGGGDSGDGWGVRDWGRFVGAWKREEKEKIRREGNGGGEKEGKEEEEMRKVDRLSSVFDWLVAQVPSSGLLVSSSSLSSSSSSSSSMKEKEQEKEKEKHKTDSEMKKHMDKVGNTPHRKRNQLASKADLESFYLGLCRKLYDEGL